MASFVPPWELHSLEEAARNSGDGWTDGPTRTLVLKLIAAYRASGHSSGSPTADTSESSEREFGRCEPEYLGLLDELRSLHYKKCADYGSDVDPLSNLTASQDWDVEPWIATMVRANDKVKRLQAAASGSTLENEGVEDSLLDLAAYSLMALVLHRRANGETKG